MFTQNLSRETLRKLVVRVLLSVILLILVGSNYTKTGAQVSDPPTVPTIVISPTGIVWQSLPAYSSARLIVVGSRPAEKQPAPAISQWEFPADVAPAFAPYDSQGQPYPDGGYTYELRLYPQLSPELTAILEATPVEEREALIAELQQSSMLPENIILSGYFTIQAGSIVTDQGALESEADQGDGSGTIPVDDVVQADDVIIIGSLCVGEFCTDGEVFNNDTQRLKQDRLRVHFEDTSHVAGFPTTDWRIVINDSNSGGANYFAIEDSDAALQVLRLSAGAPANSIYVSANGNLGVGTATPLAKFHLVTGNTPNFRLDQDGSSGWPTQVWDIAGNDLSFFIRDVTHANYVPFRIAAGAPSGSLAISVDGKVGIGTASPAAQLHIEGVDGVMPMRVRNGSDVVIFAMDESGNVTMGGALTEASDVNVKENFAPVDDADVLSRIDGLSVTTWNYIGDGASVRHMGPMAQDFYAAFGLGSDDTHIAPLDVNGVLLSGVQALIAQSEQQDARIQQLEQENAALEQRLDLLEAQVNALLAAQED
ncbi:MAG: tail fiber domain-containing protein [Anaerolineae bacterium]|nr:tail fiber domain-containing protein [Anaerolineae bacterium]